FADLYNTFNNRPMVGVFDIMDSGGFGGLGIQGTYSDTIYYLEGGLPTLPSAWHRMMVWGDEFRNENIYSEANDLNFYEDIEIAPAERPLSGLSNPKYFVKIPINEDEYILIENRQVDPNEDGDLAFKGGLPITEGETDFRVLLHPTSPIPGFDEPTFEYDWMLPGWLNPDLTSTGGGLIFWHINDRVIYEEGVIDSNGDFISNYENNSVNQDYYSRGVEIIEADGLADIGNPSSLWWRGTAYEAFYRDKPDLEDNTIVGWLSSPEGTGSHAGEFSSTTNPAFCDSYDNPVWWKIYDISTFQNTMSFKLSTNIMENSYKFSDLGDIKNLSPAFINDGLNLVGVNTNTNFHLFCNYDQNDVNGWDWLTETSSNYSSDFPIQVFDFDDNGNEEIIYSSSNQIHFVEGYLSEFSYTFTDTIISPPQFVRVGDSNYAVIPFEDKVLFRNDENEDKYYQLPSLKLSFDGEDILAIDENHIHRINIENDEVVSQHISQNIGAYSPVVFHNNKIDERIVFQQTNNGDILKITSENSELIFENISSKLPSQLAISDFEQNGLATLTFGLDNQVFALTVDGSLLDEFPITVENISFKSYSPQNIVRFFETPVMLLESDNGGILAYDNKGNYKIEYSYFGNVRPDCQQYTYNETEGRLYFINVDENDNLFFSFISGYEENPILKKNGVFSSDMEEIIDENTKFTAYAFPNPATSSMRFRVFAANEDIQVKVFDISGNLLFEESKEKIENKYQDVYLNTQDLSSGVYFGIVKSGKDLKKIKFGIEK
ncbi:MAG: T9SS type A sorting domain-containing protein, partial [Candidatus Cloacimonadota bacterium]|nr:T9SS type A sorting domain-containing protein [Candidatus Cloacimonadota bacterium]